VLTLRPEPVRGDHAAAVYPYLCDSRLYTFIDGSKPSSVAALEARFLRWAEGSSDPSEPWYNWISFDGAQPIGTLQATIREGRATLGYVVFRPFWGRGFATAGCRWLMQELFTNHPVRQVYAFVDARNVASLRVAQAAGLRKLARHESPAELSATDVAFTAHTTHPR
jgi:[ribosomal protein S5]-alanine N-acetyltransferase